MKKIPIIAGILVIVGAILLIRASQDMSTYATFDQARDSGELVKIAGILAKNKEMYYDAEKDPNYFSFYLTDAEGDQNKVVLLAEKPQDFERSEQVVVTGKMNGDEFVATDMLMKCPSKYKDEEIYVRSKGES
ncbi:MAG: cytochrome c maturation protein CcmE [Saprospiraceae bacterium]|nr:cytochrome c maturation protein CcmE [Saprospiraceae bacterium]